MAAEQYHIMVFPWLAFGHMLPMLEFAKKLATKGCRISFVSTPKNLQGLPKIPRSFTNRLKMVEIELPLVPGLPQGSEATIDLEKEHIQFLKKAYDAMSEPFEDVLGRDLPDLLLIDFAPFWIPKIAKKHRVSVAFLSVYSASTLAFLGPPDELRSGKRRTKPEDFTSPPPWIKFESLVSHRPDYAPTMMRNTHFPDASGVSSGHRLSTIIDGSDFVVIRTCKEFEGEYINLLEKLYKKPVLALGLLPPILNKDDQETNSSCSSAFEWLSKQRQKSVVFVGFGSEYKMPINQIHELASGLEISQIPFLWILRKPEKSNDVGELLPAGFVDRTLNLGRIIQGWAPQQNILAHPSIGGCLFHSGWSTIIESLGFGHPQILMPMVADQGLNAKLLVEKGVGYEVPRNRDGSFSRDEVADSIRFVMSAREGQEIRSKAAQMAEIFSNQKLHDNYIDQFFQHFQSTQLRRS